MDVPGFALVTGSGSGIGRACAETFARDGAAGVALVDMNEAALQEVKAAIDEQLKKRGQTCQIEVFPLNVTDEQEVERVVAEVAQKFGRLDYVINAAGTACKHPGGSAFVETEDWRRVMSVNLDGSFFILRAAARIMLKQDPIKSSIDGRPLSRGSIVNFSSIQGLVGITLSTAYCTSKTAILGLTRVACDDYAKDGIRINAICPGYTETPMTTKNPMVWQAMQERVVTAVPMQRVGQPQEIADGVVWLAGGRSSFVNGIALSVDGGYCAR
jgi:NAD(P)-dependent dehydrogenase (short-subunit alcohol dehydrogenase family)